MDWTKAKNILIVALLLTNIFLIYVYVIKENNLTNEDESALIQHLESKDIFVNAEIPSKVSKMPVLTVMFSATDEDLIISNIENQEEQGSDIEASDSKNAQYIANHFLKKCMIWTENVTFSHLEQLGDKTIIHYKNMVDGIALEESFIRCTVENNKVVALERYWIEPVSWGKTKQEIIPASAALLSFAKESNRDEKEKLYIEDITIVYWLDRQTFESESTISDTALPAWRITYNQGKVAHISAFE